MHWSECCAVVIPCLNESGSVGSVIDAVREHLPTVIVVDDGSADGTDEAATAHGARVLRHPRPLGKGAALCSGWRAAVDSGFGWALCMDGDGQHAATDIPSFLRCAERTGAAMVIGDRMHNPAGMPWLRRRVNRWMSRRLSKLSGQTLPDTQNGFRLMDLRHWQPRPSGAAHFEIESDVLMNYLLLGLRVEFIPVEVIYGDERSKIHPWRDTVRWFRWWRDTARRFQVVGRHA